MRIFFNSYDTQNKNFNFKSKVVTKTVKKVTEAQIKREQRNQTVLKMLSEGFSKKEIAELLKIDISTINNLLKKIDGFRSTLCLQKERIIAFLKEGMTLEKIAKKENVPNHVVRYIAKKAEIKTTTDFQKKMKERNDKILEMLLAEVPRKDIAQQMGVHCAVVNRIAEKHGAYKIVSENKTLRIKEKLQEGYTMKEVAKQENINPTTVYRRKHSNKKQ